MDPHTILLISILFCSITGTTTNANISYRIWVIVKISEVNRTDGMLPQKPNPKRIGIDRARGVKNLEEIKDERENNGV
jgi:hypothetical protein